MLSRYALGILSALLIYSEAEAQDLSAFFTDLERAPRSLKARNSSLQCSLRAFPIFSKRAVKAAQLKTNLTVKQRRALERVLKLEVKEPIYFLGVLLQKQTYFMGLRQQKAGLSLALTNDKGRQLACSFIQINSPTKDIPKLFIEKQKSQSTLVIQCRGRFNFPYVRKKDRDKIALKKRVRARSGLVTVTTETELKKVGESLAKTGNSMIPILCKALGKSLPKKPLELHLFTSKDRFQNAMRLTRRRGSTAGFASRITGECYIHYWPRHSPADQADQLLPMMFRRDCIHELFHLLCYRLYPNSQKWPLWISEGLAEWATLLALEDLEGEQKNFQEFHRARLKDSSFRQPLPSLRQVKSWDSRMGPEASYAAGFFLVEQMHKTKRLLPFLTQLESGVWNSHKTLSQLFKNENQWQEFLKGKIENTTTPASLLGCMDFNGRRYRIVSSEGGVGLSLVEAPNGKAGIQFQCQFALRPVGRREALLIFGYQGHRGNASFIAVRLSPTTMTISYFKNNKETVWLTAKHAKALKIEQGLKSHWHEFKAQLTATELRVTFQGKTRRAAVPKELKFKQSRVGIGCQDGVIYYRKIVLKSLSR